MNGENVTQNQLRQKTKRCVACNRLFETSREHAKTCSHTCRQTIYRRKRKLELKSDRVAWNMQDLLDALADPIVAAKAYKLINRCKATVKDVVIEADNSPYARQLALFEMVGG